MSLAIRHLETPLGRYLLEASREGLCSVKPEDATPRSHAPGTRGDAAAERHLDEACRALDAYFAGRRLHFDDLALAPSGTPFQQSVWRALREIPFGRTESYGGLARRIGHAGAARAVGGANHENPLAIVVPCHRVIGAGGALTGYAGGLVRKRWLLRHEGALLV